MPPRWAAVVRGLATEHRLSGPSSSLPRWFIAVGGDSAWCRWCGRDRPAVARGAGSGGRTTSRLLLAAHGEKASCLSPQGLALVLHPSSDLLIWSPAVRRTLPLQFLLLASRSSSYEDLMTP